MRHATGRGRADSYLSSSATTPTITSSRGPARHAVRRPSPQLLLDPVNNEPPPGSTINSVRWSGVAVIGKQAVMLAGAIVLARLLGPNTYSVISAAMIYVTLSTLLLDQGMSAALIQRGRPTPGLPGAAATVNIAAGIVLGAATFVLAPDIANFLHTDRVTDVLRILGAGLLLKAVAVAPRAMLSRALKFRPIARADVTGSIVGVACGVTSALLGARYDAILYQTLTADLVVAMIMMKAVHGPRPNFRMDEVRALMPFGARIFATNSIAYFSRNIDNILVARFLGALALSFYAMAYRVLVIPVQMLGQTVNRVLFPIFSRQAHRPDQLGRTLLLATEMLAMITLPLMTALSCSAHELVAVGLGSRWLPTAPLISVLALAGARETIFYITPSLMMAMGRADLNLRFEIVSTGIQVAGIVIGLQFSEFGVALGYALAGLLVTPVMLIIQQRLTGIALRRQVAAMWPAIHASAWAAAGYLAIRQTGLPNIGVLALGLPAFGALYVGVLMTFHRRVAKGAAERMTKLRPGSRGSKAVVAV